MGLVKKLGANYGQSEMTPAYWLQVFLFGKQKASTFVWFDEINNVAKEANLGFYNVLTRYILSFIINGLGYHIIIHSFPIQAANRYTYIGLLWAGCGMMFLVQLDNVSGQTLTVKHLKANFDDEHDVETPLMTEKILGKEEVRMSEEAEKIISDAREKLDALASGQRVINAPRNATHNLKAGVLLVAERGNSDASIDRDDEKIDEVNDVEKSNRRRSDVFHC